MEPVISVIQLKSNQTGIVFDTLDKKDKCYYTMKMEDIRKLYSYEAQYLQDKQELFFKSNKGSIGFKLCRIYCSYQKDYFPYESFVQIVDLVEPGLALLCFVFPNGILRPIPITRIELNELIVDFSEHVTFRFKNVNTRNLFQTVTSNQLFYGNFANIVNSGNDSYFCNILYPKDVALATFDITPDHLFLHSPMNIFLECVKPLDVSSEEGVTTAHYEQTKTKVLLNSFGQFKEIKSNDGASMDKIVSWGTLIDDRVPVLDPFYFNIIYGLKGGKYNQMPIVTSYFLYTNLPKYHYHITKTGEYHLSYRDEFESAILRHCGGMKCLGYRLDIKVLHRLSMDSWPFGRTLITLHNLNKVKIEVYHDTGLIIISPMPEGGILLSENFCNSVQSSDYYWDLSLKTNLTNQLYPFYQNTTQRLMFPLWKKRVPYASVSLGKDYEFDIFNNFNYFSDDIPDIMFQLEIDDKPEWPDRPGTNDQTKYADSFPRENFRSA